MFEICFQKIKMTIYFVNKYYIGVIHRYHLKTGLLWFTHIKNSNVSTEICHKSHHGNLISLAIRAEKSNVGK